ncbi:uncharacterized protein MYCFIDRAFT_208806 [Pseudocercospora fijiensis CIRAD86]|uniref:Uncharacterized protein n=1 Tax=Pseudocercospora fijiensis (strain CIRAD86) TaxID=383855 RepID=M2ZK59_PSEFD|nr:uncharacterized protein MYCFIDRAFT_208806 [Pseudocercospora fijiensis CIRAD86]EME79489.1 hypothetical protein MYCFIDRAFT_208806 [Pseudocercospora fijiensis CIRAD86]
MLSFIAFGVICNTPICTLIYNPRGAYNLLSWLGRGTMSTDRSWSSDVLRPSRGTDAVPQPLPSTTSPSRKISIIYLHALPRGNQPARPREESSPRSLAGLDIPRRISAAAAAAAAAAAVAEAETCGIRGGYSYCCLVFCTASARTRMRMRMANMRSQMAPCPPPPPPPPPTRLPTRGQPRAKQRWAANGDMTFVSTSVYNSTTTAVFASTLYTTITSLGDNATPYTLCDGFPRINASRTVTSIEIPHTLTQTVAVTTSIPTPIPQPNCTIGPADCSSLLTAWRAASAAFQSFSATGPTATPPPYVPSPICGSATVAPQSVAVDDPLCVMNAASVQLLYWPVQTVTPCDACHRSLSDCPTTTAGPTISGKPNTIVWRNQTLTSPTAYIAFEGSWAYTVGETTHTTPQTIVIPQDPASVSTYCGKPGGGYSPPKSVNYNNFNSPIPADVYRCQPSCFTNPLPWSAQPVPFTYTDTIDGMSLATENLCSTIWNDYAPVLSIPEAFKTINPAGYVDMFGVPSVCRFIFDEDAVLFDPPIALTEVDMAARPTLPRGNSAEPTPTETYTMPNAPTVPTAPTANQPTVPTRTAVAVAESQVAPSNVQPLPYPPDSQNAGQPPPTKTSPSVADIIASVMGMTAPNNGRPGTAVTLAYATDGSAIVVNGATASLGNENHNAGNSVVRSGTISVAGTSYPWSKVGSSVIIDGQSLSPGARIAVNGQTISLVGDSHVVAISGDVTSTMNLEATATSALSEGSGGVITGGSNTLSYTTSGGVLVIGGHTLTPGETITLGAESSTPTASTTQHTSSRSNTAAHSTATTTSGSSKAESSGIWRILLTALLIMIALFAAW